MLCLIAIIAFRKTPAKTFNCLEQNSSSLNTNLFLSMKKVISVIFCHDDLSLLSMSNLGEYFTNSTSPTHVSTWVGRAYLSLKYSIV